MGPQAGGSFIIGAGAGEIGRLHAHPATIIVDIGGFAVDGGRRPEGVIGARAGALRAPRQRTHVVEGGVAWGAARPRATIRDPPAGSGALPQAAVSSSLAVMKSLSCAPSLAHNTRITFATSFPTRARRDIDPCQPQWRDLIRRPMVPSAAAGIIFIASYVAPGAAGSSAWRQWQMAVSGKPIPSATCC